MIEKLLYRTLKFLRRMKCFPLMENFISIQTNPSLLEVQMLPEKFLNQLKVKMLKSTEQHKIGDIVYVLFDPIKTLRENLPSIGTDREIDCKVLVGPLKTTNSQVSEYYVVISGRGEKLKVDASMLVSAKNVHEYRQGKKLITTEDTELCPAGTLFVQNGQYFVCDPMGIYIHQDRIDALNHIFK